MEGSRLSKECHASSSCVLVFLVYGQSDFESRYRIRVLRGTNKLYEGNAIFDTVNAGDFKYYWFISLGGLFASRDPTWQHNIGVGVKTPGADVDMYVSVYDGRNPTIHDNDFSSTNFGADAVILKASDLVFQHTNPDALKVNQGLVVVVGIHNSGSSTAQFSLVERQGFDHLTDVEDLITNDSRTVTLSANRQRTAANPETKVFRWYNWEHGNFNIQVRAIQGKANFYVNFVGESNYEENMFSGIPTNKNDSMWSAQLDSFDSNNRTAAVSIYRFDTDQQPLFCYDCWYYVTVVVEDPTEVIYRVFFQRLQDVGNDFLQMDLE